MSSKLNLGVRCYAYMHSGAVLEMLTGLKADMVWFAGRTSVTWKKQGDVKNSSMSLQHQWDRQTDRQTQQHHRTLALTVTSQLGTRVSDLDISSMRIYFLIEHVNYNINYDIAHCTMTRDKNCTCCMCSKFRFRWGNDCPCPNVERSALLGYMTMTERLKTREWKSQEKRFPLTRFQLPVQLPVSVAIVHWV